MAGARPCRDALSPASRQCCSPTLQRWPQGVRQGWAGAGRLHGVEVQRQPFIISARVAPRQLLFYGGMIAGGRNREGCLLYTELVGCGHLGTRDRLGGRWKGGRCRSLSCRAQVREGTGWGIIQRSYRYHPAHACAQRFSQSAIEDQYSSSKRPPSSASPQFCVAYIGVPAVKLCLGELY